MASNSVKRSAYVGYDAIMQAYDTFVQQTPYWALWYNSEKKAFQFNEKDMQNGIDSREFLASNIRALIENEDNAYYYLTFYLQSEPAYTKKSLELSSFPIRATEYEPGQSGVTRYTQVTQPAQISGYPGNELKEFIKELHNATNSRIDAIQAKIESDIQDSEVEIESMFDKIMRVVNDPKMAPVIHPLMQVVSVGLQGVFSKFNMGTMNGPGPMAMNGEQNNNFGVDNETDEVLSARVMAALDRLQKVCDLPKDLELLADMAEKDPNTFNFLLNNLRR